MKYLLLFVTLMIAFNKGITQKYTATLKAYDREPKNRDLIVNDYVSPIISSIFYSNNNESNKYIYSFYPDHPLLLGRGTDPNKVQETRFSPLEEITKDTVDGTKPLSTTADIFLVSNKEELKKVFELDVKLSVRYLGFKGNSAMNIVNSYNFEQNNILIVIKGQSEFSRVALKNPRLSEEAKKIINKPNGYSEFVKLYGSNIVAMERRGVSVYFLITINNVSSSTRNSINASLEASGSFGPLSGKLEMKLRQEVYQRSQKEDLNIRFLSYGGEGLSDFASIIKKLKTQGNSFEDIKDELSKAIKSYSTFENSIPIGYLVTPIFNIPNVYFSKRLDTYSELQEKYLGAVVEKYSENFSRLTLFKDIISQKNPLSWYTTSTDLENIHNGITVLEEYLERLKNLHDTLLNHFDYFEGKPVSEIEERLIYINSDGIRLLREANSAVETKYFTIKSDKDRFVFSGFGIKGINFFLQGELYDYTKSESIDPNVHDYEKSNIIFEIIPMETIDGKTIPSRIMGSLTSFEIKKEILRSNLESGAEGLNAGSPQFKNESNHFKYFSVTCIVTSVFGKQIRIPIAYMLYDTPSTSYKCYLRPEVNFITTSFINRN